MQFDTIINSIPVHAVYSDECVNQIFLPLLRNLTDRVHKEKKRMLVFLAAAPGTGKSTLAEFLRQLSQSDPALEVICVTSIDGFHRYQEYLMSHKTERDGKEMRLVDIKGHPSTFDLNRLTSFVRRVSEGEDLMWPEYDRLLHDPREDVIPVRGNIVLLEGNYLLLDEDGWRDLRNYADCTISITADPEMLRRRLVERRVLSNVGREESEAFVEFSDMYNARLILSHLLRADVELEMTGDGEYRSRRR